MIERATCLDTSVLVKSLTDEEPLDDSRLAQRILQTLVSGGRIIAPAFAWAEVGSVLKQKVRQSILSVEQASFAWSRLGLLPIQYLNGAEVRERSWTISTELGLPTLYDASFLACCEIESARVGQSVTLLTADRVLLNHAAGSRYAYVRDFRDTL